MDTLDFEFYVYKIKDDILYSKFLSAFCPPQEFEISPFTGCLFFYRDNRNYFYIYRTNSEDLLKKIMVDFIFDFDPSQYMKITFLFGKVLEVIKSEEIIER
jgi:hypothetical protein